MPMASARKSKTSPAPALRVVAGGKAAAAKAEPGERGKRIKFDLETWHALDLLARDSMKSFQELADEAFRDLLHKHGRPVDLKDALKKSLKQSEQPKRRKKETDKSA
jgi:hypothetical protein